MISRAHQFRCVQCALIKFGQSSFARKTGSAVFDRGSIEVNIIIIANTEIAIEFGRVSAGGEKSVPRLPVNRAPPPSGRSLVKSKANVISMESSGFNRNETRTAPFFQFEFRSI